MSSRVANWFGVAADTIATLAVAASAFAITLPYRLSPAQDALLGVAWWVQLAGPMVAIGLGIVSLRGDTRARRLGYLALALSIPTLLLALLMVHTHSTSRW